MFRPAGSELLKLLRVATSHVVDGVLPLLTSTQHARLEFLHLRTSVAECLGKLRVLLGVAGAGFG